MACDCRKECVRGSCLCIDNGFKCTDSCKNDSCDNMRRDEDELSAYSEEHSDDDDDYDDTDMFFI